MSNSDVRTPSDRDRDQNEPRRATTVETQEEGSEWEKIMDQLPSPNDGTPYKVSGVPKKKSHKRRSTIKKGPVPAINPILPKGAPEYDAHVEREVVTATKPSLPENNIHIEKDKISNLPDHLPRKADTDNIMVDTMAVKKPRTKRTAAPIQLPGAVVKNSKEEALPAKNENIPTLLKPEPVKEKHPRSHDEGLAKNVVPNRDVTVPHKPEPVKEKHPRSHDEGLAKNGVPSRDVIAPKEVQQKHPRSHDEGLAKNGVPSRDVVAPKEKHPRAPVPHEDGLAKTRIPHRSTSLPNAQPPKHSRIVSNIASTAAGSAYSEGLAKSGIPNRFTQLPNEFPQKSKIQSNYDDPAKDETLNVSMQEHLNELAPRLTNNNNIVDTQFIKKPPSKRGRQATSCRSPPARATDQNFSDDDASTRFEKISTPTKPAVVKETYRWLKKQKVKLTRSKPLGVSSDSVASVRDDGSSKAHFPSYRTGHTRKVLQKYNKLKDPGILSDGSRSAHSSRSRSAHSSRSRSAHSSSHNSKHSSHKTPSDENSKKK